MSRIVISSSCPCEVCLSLGFRPVASSPTCSLSRPPASSTSLARTRVNPWSGVSGCLPNPTSHTGYEHKICADVNDEHTPIKLPDSTRNSPRNHDATIISTTEDPEGFQHSGASSCSKHTAASRLLTSVRIIREWPLETDGGL